MIWEKTILRSKEILYREKRAGARAALLATALLGIIGSKEMSRTRKCRNCKTNTYLTPSKYPGTCSAECYSKRKTKLRKLREIRKLFNEYVRGF